MQKEQVIKKMAMLSEEILGIDSNDFEKAIKEKTPMESLGVDSLDLIDYVMQIENAFKKEGKNIHLEDEKKFTTLKVLVDYVYEKVNE